MQELEKMPIYNENLENYIDFKAYEKHVKSLNQLLEYRRPALWDTLYLFDAALIYKIHNEFKKIGSSADEIKISIFIESLVGDNPKFDERGYYIFEASKFD